MKPQYSLGTWVGLLTMQHAARRINDLEGAILQAVALLDAVDRGWVEAAVVTECLDTLFMRITAPTDKSVQFHSRDVTDLCRAVVPDYDRKVRVLSAGNAAQAFIQTLIEDVSSGRLNDTEEDVSREDGAGVVSDARGSEEAGRDEGSAGADSGVGSEVAG
jgi:hypothetical protein